MVTKELLAYLENSLKSGYKEDDLTKALIAAGWNPQDVTEGFTTLKGGTPAENAPQATTAKPAAPQTFVVSNAGSATPTRPASTPAVLSRLAAQTTDLTSMKPIAQKSGRRWVMPLVIVVIVLLVGGSTGYAYMQGWISIPFLSSGTYYEPSELLAKLLPKTLEIKSVSYKVSFSLAGTQRDADAAPLSIEIPELAERQPLYDRDAQRFNDISAIKNGLGVYASSHKNLYPNTLADVFPKASGRTVPVDPNTKTAYTYAPSSNKTNFTLAVTLETQEAIDAIMSYSDRFQGAARASSTPLINDTNPKWLVFNKQSLGSYYYFTPRPQRPMLVDVLEAQNSYLNYLPGDFSFLLALSGAATGQTGQNVDTRFQGSATFAAGDFAGSADAEFTRKDGMYYVRLNKFPSFFFDPSAIKGKWVKITQDDIVSASGAWGSLLSGESLSFATTSEERTAASLAQLKQFFQIAEEEKAFVATGGEKEQYEGREVYRYRLAMNQEKIASFYKRLADTFASTYGTNTLIALDQKTVDYMQTSAFQSVFNYFKANGSLNVLTDAKTGYPASITYQFRLVPDNAATKLKDKQFVLSAAIDLTDINNPPAITAPAETLSFDDAQALLAGVSKERFAFHKQNTGIQKIRSALETYKTLAGRYPENLADLLSTANDIDAKHHFTTTTPSFSYTKERYGLRKIMDAVPQDVFGGGSFGYTIAKNDYALTYAIKLPPFRENNVAFFDAVDSQTMISKKITEKFVEGKNTATSKILSQEAVTQSKIDADKDGISDTLEAHFGTDPQKSDTDGDGKSDSEELMARTNPSGVGALEVNSRDYYFGF